jgi:hypothetical protein
MISTNNADFRLTQADFEQAAAASPIFGLAVLVLLLQQPAPIDRRRCAPCSGHPVKRYRYACPPPVAIVRFPLALA